MLSDQQIIDRLTLGAVPGLRDAMRGQSPEGWIAAQLEPGDEPQTLVEALSGLDAATLDTSTLLARNRPPPGALKDPQVRKQFQMRRRELYRQSVTARILYGTRSPWQLRELLVDFWFNHFNIFAFKGLCTLWVGAFEREAIRPHVLGRFEDLLLATAHHPAMLIYLDNHLNAAPGGRGGSVGFNENYAREVMELHTVGLHYTQADVLGATRLLSGWGIDGKGQFRFFPRRHDYETQTILGQRFGGGEDAIIAFLKFLAASPDTAEHISFELAQYFVSDAPPRELVKDMAARFLTSGGDLKAVTATMIVHPQFAAAAAARNKFRTPYRYLLALLRASGRNIDRPLPLLGALNQLGQPLYGCVQPNGYASTQAEWLSADALTTRVNIAVALGGGWMQVDSNFPRGTPIALETVAATLHPTAELSSQAAAAPVHLQAAVLLGSPYMQFC
jgi:uncharacterized protein (DUF1800 family)